MCMQIIRIRLTSSDGKSKGCEKAPVEVLKALKEIKSSEKGKIVEFEKLSLEEIHVNLEDIPEANYLIYENSKEIFEKNPKCFFIGGDHIISYSILRAFNKIEKVPFLIVFDAHFDCADGGRIVSCKNWLGKLIEEGFNGRNIVLISSRNFSAAESGFLKDNNINHIGMDLLREDIEGICDLVMERARDSSGFYISIDMNCLDSCFAPGANCLEPGGLSSGELIYFVKRLALLDNFRGADIVEINPDKDLNKISVRLGARVLAEML